MEMAKKAIIDELNRKSKDFTTWFVDRPMEAMGHGPKGAWTAGQHLLHLIKSTKPLAKGVGYPLLLLRLKFGKPNGPSRSYEELVKCYTDGIAEGGVATGPYVPREVKKQERDLLVERFKTEVRVLVNNLHKWSEKDLDRIAVDHPLLGKITMREMLYFTIYHTEHHLKILEERYA